MDPLSLPPESLILDCQTLDGCGVAPDLIYAERVPNIPHPSPGADFDKFACSLLHLVEVGFCADLSCHIKRDEKAGMYDPLAEF